VGREQKEKRAGKTADFSPAEIFVALTIRAATHVVQARRR
jgi:hypothetical protein